VTLLRKLTLSPSSKSLLHGFYDPTGRKDNYLEIYYTYMEKRHRIILADEDELDLPSAKDALR
jgi:hypothetical protein